MVAVLLVASVGLQMSDAACEVVRTHKSRSSGLSCQANTKEERKEDGQCMWDY